MKTEDTEILIPPWIKRIVIKVPPKGIEIGFRESGPQEQGGDGVFEVVARYTPDENHEP